MKKGYKVLVGAVVFVMLLTLSNVYLAKAADSIGKAKVTSVGKTKKGMTIKWSKVKKASGYKLELYSSGHWVEKKTINKGTTTKVTIKLACKQGKSYKFRIRAFKKSGKGKLYGAAPKAYQYTSPKSVAVTGLKQVKGRNKNTLTWKKVKGASRYYVYRRSGKKYKKIAITKSNKYVNKTKNSDAKYKVVSVAPKKRIWYDPECKLVKKWVVDRKAWTEYLNKPIFEKYGVYVMNYSKKEFESDKEFEVYMNYILGCVAAGYIDEDNYIYDENGKLLEHGTNYHVESRTRQSGTIKQKVTHKEKGYWKTYKIITKAGYWK